MRNTFYNSANFVIIILFLSFLSGCSGNSYDHDSVDWNAFHYACSKIAHDTKVSDIWSQIPQQYEKTEIAQKILYPGGQIINEDIHHYRCNKSLSSCKSASEQEISQYEYVITEKYFFKEVSEHQYKDTKVVFYAEDVFDH